MFRPVLFVNRRNDQNIGDRLSSPIQYFSKDYPGSISVEIHVSDSRWTRRISSLLRDRVRAIVVGGGGLLGQSFFKHDLEFWQNTQVPLVLWGAGHNSHDPYAVANLRPSAADYSQVRMFSAIGIRDYEAGFCWVPCASCMHPALSEKPDVRFGVVIALHRDMRGDTKSISQIIGQSKDAVVVYNDSPPRQFIGALRSASVVITNSYHACYWATLMGKPVVAIGGGSKILTLKHPVEISTFENWKEAAANALVYPRALQECRDRNSDFNKRVKYITSSRSVAYERSLPVRDTLAEQAADFASMKEKAPPLLKQKVPKVVHFIYGLSPDFGGKPFNIMHYLAILSVVEKIKPEEIFFHYQYLPDTEYFRLIRHHLTLNAIDAPDEISGRKLKHFAHKADVLRMRILRDVGGIYLDLDTIVVSSFDGFLEKSVTIGMQASQTEGKQSRNIFGLCNAVVIASPNDKFITDWFQHYKNFRDDIWDDFSVVLPYTMWRSGRWPVNVVSYDSFHWPLWDNKGLKMMFEENHVFPNAVCHHLWESQSFNKYFPEANFKDAREVLTNAKSTYARLARPYL